MGQETQEQGQQRNGPQRVAIRDLQQVAYFVAYGLPIVEWRLQGDDYFWAIFDLTADFKAVRLAWPTSPEAAVFSKYRLLQDTVDKLHDERGDNDGRRARPTRGRRGRRTE